MTIEVRLPELGEGITGATITSILVKPGDVVKAETGVVEVETEKAAIEVPAQAAGKVLEILVKAGDRARVGQAIIMVEGASTASPQASPAPTQAVPAAQSAVVAIPVGPATATPVAAAIEGEGAPAAPFVRKLAREMGLDIRKVPGTGPGGRISAEDVASFARRLLSGGAAGAANPPLPDLARWGEVVREPMSGIRRATAENMVVSSGVPTVTQFDRADLSPLEAVRLRLRKEEPDKHVTITAFTVAAVAAMLKEFPKFNSSVDMARGEIVTKKYISIGVAVDTPRGLMVPVIRGADRKDFHALAVEMAELAEKARSKRLTVEEMRGGTFSISNLGSLGTTYFTPLLNWPDVAVLGMGRATQEYVHMGKTFETRLIMPLSLTYDHRIIDGAEAARFLRRIAESLTPKTFGL